MIGAVFRHHMNYTFSYSIFLTSKSVQITQTLKKKGPYIWKRNNNVKWRGKKIYWGLLFYCTWKFWLAIINALLASLLSCWHSLPYFTSVIFNLKLCQYGFALLCSCSKLLQKSCVCLPQVSNPVPPGACSLFTFCVSYCSFHKTSLQVNHAMHKLE